MAPKSPTFAIQDMGVRVLNLALMKGIQPYEITTPEHGKYKGSNHVPILMDAHVTRQPVYRKGRVPKHAQTHPSILNKAAQKIKLMTTKFLSDISECGNIDDFQRNYDKIWKHLLAPWGATRVIHADRFRPGWTVAQDQTARLRPNFYRLANINNHAAWISYRRVDGEVKNEVKKRKFKRRNAIIKALSTTQPTQVSNLTRSLSATASDTSVRKISALSAPVTLPTL